VASDAKERALPIGPATGPGSGSELNWGRAVLQTVAPDGVQFPFIESGDRIRHPIARRFSQRRDPGTFVQLREREASVGPL